MSSNTNPNILTIRKATETILSSELDFSTLTPAIKQLYVTFSTLSEVDFDTPEMEETVYLKTGVAIAPKWAGCCINDLLRTKRFISGIYKAIKTKQEEHPGKPITVMYTGTGPFATLLMPLTTIFSPKELQLILLEVNPYSVESLKRVITKMEASAYIQSIHLCDASTYKLPKNTNADILVIECLQHALAREPQVAIGYNLVPQFTTTPVLIPQEISLHIAALDISGLHNAMLENSDSPASNFITQSEAIFSLTTDSILKNAEAFQQGDFEFPEVAVHFSEKQLAHKTSLAILTEIKVYETENITFQQSGLTIPATISSTLDVGSKKTITTRYILGEDPYLATKID